MTDDSSRCEKCGGRLEGKRLLGAIVSITCAVCGETTVGTASYVSDIPRPEWVRLFATWKGPAPSPAELGVIRKLFPEYQAVSLRSLSDRFSGQSRSELGRTLRTLADELVQQAL